MTQPHQEQRQRGGVATWTSESLSQSIRTNVGTERREAGTGKDASNQGNGSPMGTTTDASTDASTGSITGFDAFANSAYVGSRSASRSSYGAGIGDFITGKDTTDY